MSFTEDHCKTAADVLASARRVQALRQASYKPRPLHKPRLAVVAPPSPPLPLPPPAPVIEAPPPAAEQPEALEPAVEFSSRPTVANIISATIGYFHLSRPHFFAPLRVYPYPLARQIAMYLAVKLTPLSMLRIGRALKRDHSTVFHGRDRITDLLAMDDRVVVAAINAISASLNMEVPDFPPVPSGPPPRARLGESWRPSEFDTLQRMRAEKAPVKVIAAALGRTDSAVGSKIKKMKKLQMRDAVK
jgi:hypothetical protein